MDQKTDAEIVARVLNGDVQAYALLIEAYKGPVFNLAFRMTGSYSDADDLTQEIFIRAYQKLPKFDQEKKFFTWLYTIGINLIRNHLKKKARDITPPALVHLLHDAQRQEHEGREGDLVSENSMLKLEKTMQKLPVDLREAVILKYYQDLTFEEVAAITGDSLSAVKMRVYRGLENLKRLMEFID
jgi:RNA polymerase sigma-70 factor, ECF subfamily